MDIRDVWGFKNTLGDITRKGIAERMGISDKNVGTTLVLLYQGYLTFFFMPNHG
jgi:transcription initiation factor IIE alpha subunit